MLFVLVSLPAGGAAPAAEPEPDPKTIDLFVSLEGNDAWSGRTARPGEKDGPFATIGCAQRAVRELRKARAVPVRVVLRGGTYYLDDPLRFGPEDSGTQEAPVNYAAAEGERVVLSGGRRLQGGRWGEANGHRAWVVDLPDVKSGPWRFRQLFVNGERRPRTRLPKEGEYQIEAIPDVPITNEAWEKQVRRFGHLFLNRGNWNGRQIIDTSWVDQATSVQVPASIPNDALPRSRGAGVYGFNWWVNGIKPDGRRLWPGAPPRTYYANGLHNNVCVVVPEWNLVIARTNGDRKDGSANTPPDVDEIWSGFFGRLSEAVAPATLSPR